MVETSESNDSQRYLKAKTAGEEKAKPWAEEPPGMGQQVRMTYVYVWLSVFEPQAEAKHNSNTFFTH